MSNPDQSQLLSILSRAPAAPIKALAEQILADVEPIGSIVVLINRTGLVMLPYTDNAAGVVFHLGEVLVSEAQVRIPTATGSAIDGYGMCLGRDLAQALAIALIDAAMTAGIRVAEIGALYDEQATVQAAAQDQLMRAVERTRVEMQTF